MSENFRDYLVALADDADLLARYKSQPGETLADARISSEEKQALRSGDAAQIMALLKQTLLEGQDIPDRVNELIGTLPKLP